MEAGLLNGSDSRLVSPIPEVLQTACSATLGIYFLSSCTRVQAPKDRLTEMHSVFLRKLLFSFMAVCSDWHAAHVPYDAHCPGCRGCNGPLITLTSQTSICGFLHSLCTMESLCIIFMIQHVKCNITRQIMSFTWRRESHYTARAGLELAILFLHLHRCWDYNICAPMPGQIVSFTKEICVCVLG